MTTTSLRTIPTDLLKESVFKIEQELKKRKEEKKRECFKVSYDSCASYFKKFEDALLEVQKEAKDCMKKIKGKITLENVQIAETEYKIRPDEWYEG